MHWNVCASERIGLLLVLPVILMLGCRADREREAPATIIVRDAAAPSADAREYDSGERSPHRIEVVVSDPRNSGATGPSPLAALVGRHVRVQFRRDALGSAAPAPIPPTGQGPGGRAVSVTGIVRSASGGWIVLERDKGTYYVSLASVLMIEQMDGPATSQVE